MIACNVEFIGLHATPWEASFMDKLLCFARAALKTPNGLSYWGQLYRSFSHPMILLQCMLRNL